jgi:hypothetical protein
MIKRSQMKLAEGHTDTDQGMDDSTQNSNHPDWNNSKMRLTGGRYGNAMYGDENSGWVSNFMPSNLAAYQTEKNIPRWWPIFQKVNKHYLVKLCAFTSGTPLPNTELQSSLSMDHVFKHLWSLKIDDDRKRRILSFILIRNLLKLQSFFRSILKMRNDAAKKIQFTLRQQRQLKGEYAELEQKVDQLQYINSLKIIQVWIRGKLKMIKAKKSKVNPAVEQVLRDPERVQNSKMIQEILIPIVLKI